MLEYELSNQETCWINKKFYSAHATQVPKQAPYFMYCVSNFRYHWFETTSLAVD